VSKPTRRVIGRGERVLPGVWRLRLPLPWPGVPHCNAWAIGAGDGVVLVDTGMHQPGSLAHLERAMSQVGLRPENVRLVVCTHAHPDHCGEAMTIVERAGCELWMHPAHGHLTREADDPEAVLMRRAEIARQSGIPEDAIARWLEQRREFGTGVAGTPAPDRHLVNGVVVETDLGPWTVVETPGHAPSHVCLHQPDRRLLLSGDHLLGRVSHYYDYGFTPDPVQEFLDSLERVEALDARLALAGHGRPFTDLPGHVEANRALVRQRLHAVRHALDGTPCTAFDFAPRVYGPLFNAMTAQWLLTKLLCYLNHLERRGEAVRLEPAGDGEPERWVAGEAAGAA
jgi:glyoxylase-like metal-dependent hydrolase (beta-lactamase superfamily II)